MNSSLMERARKFLQAHRKKSIWYRLTTLMAAVVVFVTTYLLILPAITMDQDSSVVIEGIEEVEDPKLTVFHWPGEESESESEDESESESETESEDESGSESGTESEDESESESGTESEDKSGSESGTKSEDESESESETGAGTEPLTEAKTETNAEKESGTGAETQTDPEPDETENPSETLPDSKTETEESESEESESEEPESGEAASGGSGQKLETGESEKESGTEQTSGEGPENGTEETSGEEPESGTEEEPSEEAESGTKDVSGEESESGTEEVSEAKSDNSAEAQSEGLPETVDDTAPDGGMYTASVFASMADDGTDMSALPMAFGISLFSMDSAVDLTDYITNAGFGSTEIEEGKNVNVSISYQIYSSVLKNAGTDTMSYQLPEGVTPITNYSGEVYDNRGNKVGTYAISTEGRITITLDQNFIDSGNVINGNISFWSKLSSTGTGEDSETTYTFSETNQVQATITIKKPEQQETDSEAHRSDINTYKQYTYDASTQTASYTVTIGTDDGTDGDITLSDTPNLPVGVTGTVSEAAITGPNSSTYHFEDYFDIDANGKITSKSDKKLPALTAGQNYTITYKVKYYGLENLNQSVSLYNGVEVKDNNHTSWSNTNIQLNHTYLSKTQYYDSGKDKIIWTITLNDFGGDLDGYTLKDVLSKAGVSIALPESVKMTEYKADGSTASYDITIDSDGYKFDKNSGYDTTSRFVIVYETDVSKDGFYSEYQNTAQLTGDGHDFSVSTDTVRVTHDTGVVDKSYIAPTSTNGINETVEGNENLRQYTWKVTLTAPADGIKQGAYYLDTLAAEGASGKVHYITAEQLKAIKIEGFTEGNSWSNSLTGGEYELQVKTDQDQWEKFENQEGSFTEFRLYFTSDLTNIKTIILDYQTTADLAGMQNGDSWNFRNTGEFSQDGGKASDSDVKKETEGGYLKKLDIGGGAGNYVYDECKGVMYYCLKVNETGTAIDASTDQEIVITDVLPKGTTLYMQTFDIRKFGYSDNTGGSNFVNSGVKLYLSNGQDAGLFENGALPNPYEPFNINDKSSFTYDQNTGELKITFPAKLLGAHSTKSIYIFYAAQITDSLSKGETKTYTNDATIYVDGKEKSTDSVTNTMTSSYLTKSVNPDADADSLQSNEIAYRILVNPTGATLNAGDSLTLLDTIQYDKYMKAVTLKAGSFHVYNVTANGTKGSEVSTSLYTVTYGEKTVPDGQKSYELEMKLRDATPYIVEYVYAFSIDEQAYRQDHNSYDGAISYTVTNDVTFRGEHVVSDSSQEDDEIVLKGSSATATTTDALILSKVDADNQVVTLPGAVFQLQKYTGTKENPDWKNNDYWEDVKQYQTGTDGTVLLGGLTYNAAYRLVEVEAPTNYVPDMEPQYFYLYSSNIAANPISYPTDFDSVAQSVVQNITITNQRSDSNNTSVIVNKLWNDSKGNPIETDGDEVIVTDKNGKEVIGIKIQLYRTTTENDTENGTAVDRTGAVSEDASTDTTVTIRPDDEGNWYHVFNNLPRDNGREETEEEYERCYYYVKETGILTTNANGTETTISDLQDSGFEVSISPADTVTGGAVTVSNTKLPGETSISVTKNWNDGNDANRPESISVTLYRSASGEIPEMESETEGEIQAPETEQVAEYDVEVRICSISWDNTWNEEHTISNLKIKASGGVISVVDLYGIASQNQISAAYSMGNNLEQSITGTYSEEAGQYDWQTKKIMKYTFAEVTGNIILKVAYQTGYAWSTDYEATVLDLPSGSTTTPSQDETEAGVPLALPTDAEPVPDAGTVSLGTAHVNDTGYSSDGWTYTWSNLPDSYYYYVLEKNNPQLAGYDASYDYTYDEADPKRVTAVTITNTPKDSTIFTVKKEWVGITPDATYQVKGELYKDNIKVEDFTLSFNDNWSKTWTDLEAGTYSVKEVAVTKKENGGNQIITEDFDVTYSSNNGSVGNTGIITITNTKKVKTTEITVTKVWKDQNGTEIAADIPEVTLQLYSSTLAPENLNGTNSEPYGKENGRIPNELNRTAVTETKKVLANNLTCKWTSLPAEDSNGNQLYYYVVEEGDYTPEITGNGSTGSSSDGGTITVTNTVTSVSVEKKWVGADGIVKNPAVTAANLPNIYVQLYRKAESDGGTDTLVGSAVTLGNSRSGKPNYEKGGWRYTWQNLPEGTYYVKEVIVSADGTVSEDLTNALKDIGYSKVTYQVESSDAESGSSSETLPEYIKEGVETASSVTVQKGAILIANHEAPTSISVEKVWSDGTENHTGETVTVQLYSSTTPPQTESEGESESQSGQQTESETQPETDPPVVTTQTKTQITIRISKWQDTSGSDVSPLGSGSLWYKILRCDASGNVLNNDWSDSAAVAVGSLLPDNSWQFNTAKLDGQTLQGETVQNTNYYYVQYGAEVDGLSGISAGVSPTSPFIVSGANETNEINLTAIVANQETEETGGGSDSGTSKKVTVLCGGINSGSYKAPLAINESVSTDSVIIKIYYDYNPGITVDDINLTANEPNIKIQEELYSFDSNSKMYAQYIVSGLSDLGGDCELTFECGNTWPKAGTDSIWVAGIEYKNSIESMENQNSDVSLMSASYEPVAYTTDGTSAQPQISGLILPEQKKAVDNPVTLGSNQSGEGYLDDSGWKYTWNNLPATNASGEKLYYYIAETSTGNYTTSYSYTYINGNPSKGISLVTVTNTPTPTPETVDITVNKVWTGYTTGVYDNYVVTVQLLQDESDYGATVELKKDNWSHTWSGLPAGHVYSVKEVSVKDRNSETIITNYETSITTSDNTITITNTSTSGGYVLPETGGTGTQPYTLGGIALSAIAALLLYIKNQRRKEGQDSS